MMPDKFKTCSLIHFHYKFTIMTMFPFQWVHNIIALAPRTLNTMLVYHAIFSRCSDAQHDVIKSVRIVHVIKRVSSRVLCIGYNPSSEIAQTFTCISRRWMFERVEPTVEASYTIVKDRNVVFVCCIRLVPLTLI